MSRYSKVPYRTVDYWDRSDYLTASVAQANGKGTRRIYSWADLVAAKVSRRFREQGVSLQNLRKVQERLGKYRKIGNPLASTRLVVILGDQPDVARAEIVDTGERLESVLNTPGQTISRDAVIMWLKPVVEELRREVEAAQKTARKRVATVAAPPETNDVAEAAM